MDVKKQHDSSLRSGVEFSVQERGIEFGTPKWSRMPDPKVRAQLNPIFFIGTAKNCHVTVLTSLFLFTGVSYSL